MENKCKLCAGFSNCPCHLDVDDDLCDFHFEVIDIEEHDAKIKAAAYNQALEDFRKSINLYLTESYDIADFVATDTAIDYAIEELRIKEE